MNNVKDGLHYTSEHEWIKIDGDTGTVGISDHAQHLLTDVVFVELPAIGKKVEQGKPACVVESVKSVSDVYTPISGTVSEVNKGLESAPELINKDPYEQGWIYKLKDFNSAEVEKLMTAEAYTKFISSQA